MNDLEESISTKDTEASGWTVVSMDEVYLNISKFSVLKGLPFVELPDFARRKQAIVNVHNVNDEICFAYSVSSKGWSGIGASGKKKKNNLKIHLSGIGAGGKKRK